MRTTSENTSRRGCTRREALRWMVGTGAGAAALGAWPGLASGAPSASGRRRPNIVFVLVDDQPHDAMGFMGRYPFLETPHMDRLARESAHCRNTFVTTSLCSPSRATFLSGQYAHTHGVRFNDGTDLPADAPNFCQTLRENGYKTALIGKWHQKPIDEPRPGFDHWVSFRGQGRYFDQLMNVNGEHVETEGYITDVLTDYAEQYLRRDHDKPFCMVLSHKAIHARFKPAPRHESAFADADLPEPESFRDTFEDKPAWLRRGLAHDGWLKEGWEASEGEPVPDEIPPREWDPKKSARLNQLRALLAVDDSLGRVMDTLEDIGALDDTIVVFSSDNGYFFGEHRRQDKRLAYEPSMRIPMLVRYPRQIEAATTVDEMLLNVDLAPTLLDFAGVGAPEAMQGTSFAPLLRGRSADWRDAFLYEYFAEPWWLPGIPTMLAVRTPRWKYITYPDDDYIDELYDLQNDPHELNNLADDPAHADRLETMRAELERLKRETNYEADLARARVSVETVALTEALRYDFKQVTGNRVRDVTGNGHDGWLTENQRVRGRHGMALAAAEGAIVRLDETPAALDPTRKPLAVSAWARSDDPNGVLACFGGAQVGFSLHVRDGRPTFSVRSRRRLYSVSGDEPLPRGAWFHLAGVIGEDQRLRLYLNGEQVGEAEGSALLSHPRNGISVGTDTGSPVGDYDGAVQWTGLIDEVRLHFGAPDAQTIREWAQ
ncbi:MAG: sulfatase-like hydrolase/transferase [Phycisphaeraceae bacterium]